MQRPWCCAEGGIFFHQRNGLFDNCGLYVQLQWSRQTLLHHNNYGAWQTVRTHHMLPDVLICDKAPQFASHEFPLSWSSEWHIKNRISSPHHPANNGWLWCQDSKRQWCNVETIEPMYTKLYSTCRISPVWASCWATLNHWCHVAHQYPCLSHCSQLAVPDTMTDSARSNRLLFSVAKHATPRQCKNGTLRGWSPHNFETRHGCAPPWYSQWLFMWCPNTSRQYRSSKQFVDQHPTLITSPASCSHYKSRPHLFLRKPPSLAVIKFVPRLGFPWTTLVTSTNTWK